MKPVCFCDIEFYGYKIHFDTNVQWDTPCNPILWDILLNLTYTLVLMATNSMGSLAVRCNPTLCLFRFGLCWFGDA
jgi:hypothetical protein